MQQLYWIRGCCQKIHIYMFHAYYQYYHCSNNKFIIPFSYYSFLKIKKLDSDAKHSFINCYQQIRLANPYHSISKQVAVKLQPSKEDELKERLQLQYMQSKTLGCFEIKYTRKVNPGQSCT